MERPTLRQLEILGEIARAGTFRGAARHLGLSQVAVSDHVKQLETRLGVSLFVRTAGGRPSLSPAGKVVLDHGRNVLFACDALIAAAQAEAAGGGDSRSPVAVPSRPAERPAPEKELVGTVAPEPEPEPEPELDLSALTPRPGFLPALPPLPQGEVVLPEPPSPEPQPVATMEEEEPAPRPTFSPADIIDDVSENPITVASHPAILSRFQDRLAAAQEAFPDRPITIDFARFTGEAVVRAFSAGQADIALFYALGEVPGLTSDYLWSEGWSLFARYDHPLAKRDAVRLSDCEDMLVILFDEGNPVRPLAEACLARAGLWPTPTVLETDDYAAIAAELDYGEAIFPAFGVTAQQFAARPGVRRLALVEPLPGVEVRRAVSPRAAEDPTIAALAGVLG